MESRHWGMLHEYHGADYPRRTADTVRSSIVDAVGGLGDVKILVTGGTGFAGKALVKRLLGLSHEVVALDYKADIETDDLHSLGARIVIGSVTDRKILEKCAEGADIVFHLAAAFRELNVPKEHYHDVNVVGTRNTLEAAYRAGACKFIYCSTCGVHGNIDNPPAGEDGPIQPADYYQQTKYEAESIVLEYHNKGLNSVIIRPAAIYGPGDPERFVMIFRRVARGMFPMFADGSTLYHPLYIDNLIDAFLLAMQAGKGDGNAYLIADEEYLEIEALVRRVATALGVEVKIPHFPILPLVVLGHIFENICRPFHIAPPIFPRRVDWYRQNRAFSIDKAKRDLGYRPRVGIDEGLKNTAEWYQQEGLLQ